MKRLALRILAMSLIAVCLNGCHLMDEIAELITGAKGGRAVSFLIFEPYEYTVDDKGDPVKFDKFNDETNGLENAYKDGVSEAAGKRPWKPIWYADRPFMEEFYDSVLKSED